jgi:hypothetical protein
MLCEQLSYCATRVARMIRCLLDLRFQCFALYLNVPCLKHWPYD